MLLTGAVSAILKPFKLDGTLIDFDEAAEVPDASDPKKRSQADIELLKTSE